MWTLIKNEQVAEGSLLSFSKGDMERNTILAGTTTEVQIQELINMWEAEDAAQVTEEVL